MQGLTEPKDADRRRETPREGHPARRRCIASGAVLDKGELMRFVIDPDGAVVLDLRGNLPGRGLWLSARRDMVEKACTRNLFARAARMPVRTPADLADQVARALRGRCLQMIGLARRAGSVTLGHETVKKCLARGQAGVLIQALDAAIGGRHKLARLAEAAAPTVPVVEVFSAAELGRALGREEVVHVALAPGGMADRFLAEVARLEAMVAPGRGQRRKLDS